MQKSCFTSVQVLIDYNLMFVHFPSFWGANAWKITAEGALLYAGP